MPFFFYHIKFELYPSSTINPPNESKKPQSKSAERGRKREFWLPPPDSDIFQTENWPRHKPVEPVADSRIERSSSRDTRAEVLSRAVIDCGPQRASIDEDRNTIVIPRDAKQEFPPPSPALVQADLGTARKDWRFGRVRVESLDLAFDMNQMGNAGGDGAREGRKRGESSSAGVGGFLAPDAEVGVGRVTKARFEGLEGKNTEVGWGIVHLYREGEESDMLREEIYAAEDTVQGEGSDGKGGDDCTIVCIPAVPSYLTPSDFLGFVGEKTRAEVSHFRMVVTGRMNRYLVLMKFRDAAVARRWKKEYDGKVFNTMEPETCHVMFIKSITFQTPTSKPDTSFPEISHDPFTPSVSNSTFLKPFPPPTPNLVELPTCPVCLERMDDTTGLLTILCQHVFHCDCLQKWKGTGCPVCRHTNPSLAQASPIANSYPHDPSNPPFGSGEASLCGVCDCGDDLWICLICGSVGCGRYKGGHAKEHWKESAHNFALEIETQHVWDYAGDTWVHRLIREKGDSKIIDLPPSTRYGRGERNDRDMEMVPREKLDNIGIEYTHLLTSQLESQRVYFEELVSKAAAKASSASAAAQSASAKAEEAISKMQELTLENKKLKDEVVTSLERDLARERKKGEKHADMARAFGKSLTEEKKVSEGLMERVEFVNKSLIAVQGELGKAREEIRELKEENRDLMFCISAEQKVKEMKEKSEEDGGLGKDELEGGTLSLPEEKEKSGGGGGKKKKGKGKA